MLSFTSIRVIWHRQCCDFTENQPFVGNMFKKSFYASCLSEPCACLYKQNHAIINATFIQALCHPQFLSQEICAAQSTLK